MRGAQLIASQTLAVALVSVAASSLLWTAFNVRFRSAKILQNNFPHVLTDSAPSIPTGAVLWGPNETACCILVKGAGMVCVPLQRDTDCLPRRPGEPLGG